MVNVGRVACIFTPFVLTLASLACVVVFILGGSRERNATLGDLYLAKVSHLVDSAQNLSNNFFPD